MSLFTPDFYHIGDRKSLPVSDNSPTETAFNDEIVQLQKDIEELPICPSIINSNKAKKYSHLINILIEEREKNIYGL